MATCAISTLIQQACANDFVTAANDVQLYRAIKHQLLCNISANGGGGGGAVWGLITGTLTNQADLVAALAAANAPDLIVDNLSLGQPVIANQAHGLGGTPSSMRVMAKCVAADNGYSIGDEIDISGLKEADPGIADNFFTFGFNVTNIWLITQVPNGVASWTLPSVNAKSGLGTGTINVANWVAKLYVWK